MDSYRSKTTTTSNDVDGDNHDDVLVVDTRYQSFAKFYIANLLNGDLTINHQQSTNFKQCLVGINGVYYNRVAISGMITDVYEMEKNFKITVDDSTGSIRVTVWKSSSNIFTSHDGMLEDFDSQQQQQQHRAKNESLFKLLDSIRSRICDPAVNHSVNYEPTQGDHVNVKGCLNLYNDELELRAYSLTRVKSATADLVNMLMPAVLHEKIYSIPAPTRRDYDEQIVNRQQLLLNKKIADININKNNDENDKQKQQEQHMQTEEKVNLQNYLLELLKQLTLTADMRNTSTTTMPDKQSISVNQLSNQLKTNKNINNSAAALLTRSQLLIELKEMEQQGLIYSCQDEYHYLPMN